MFKLGIVELLKLHNSILIYDLVVNSWVTALYKADSVNIHHFYFWDKNIFRENVL